MVSIKEVVEIIRADSRCQVLPANGSLPLLPSPAHIVESELVELFQIVTFGSVMFRIDGTGVDMLTISVNARNNQQADQVAYLYPMANVRSNAHQ